MLTAQSHAACGSDLASAMTMLCEALSRPGPCGSESTQCAASRGSVKAHELAMLRRAVSRPLSSGSTGARFIAAAGSVVAHAPASPEAAVARRSEGISFSLATQRAGSPLVCRGAATTDDELNALAAKKTGSAANRYRWDAGEHRRSGRMFLLSSDGGNVIIRPTCALRGH